MTCEDLMGLSWPCELRPIIKDLESKEAQEMVPCSGNRQVMKDERPITRRVSKSSFRPVSMRPKLWATRRSRV